MVKCNCLVMDMADLEKLMQDFNRSEREAVRSQKAFRLAEEAALDAHADQVKPGAAFKDLSRVQQQGVRNEVEWYRSKKIKLPPADTAYGQAISEYVRAGDLDFAAHMQNYDSRKALAKHLGVDDVTGKEYHNGEISDHVRVVKYRRGGNPEQEIIVPKKLMTREGLEQYKDHPVFSESPIWKPSSKGVPPAAEASGSQAAKAGEAAGHTGTQAAAEATAAAGHAGKTLEEAGKTLEEYAERKQLEEILGGALKAAKKKLLEQLSEELRQEYIREVPLVQEATRAWHGIAFNCHPETIQQLLDVGRLSPREQIPHIKSLIENLEGESQAAMKGILRVVEMAGEAQAAEQAIIAQIRRLSLPEGKTLEEYVDQIRRPIFEKAIGKAGAQAFAAEAAFGNAVHETAEAARNAVGHAEQASGKAGGAMESVAEGASKAAEKMSGKTKWIIGGIAAGAAVALGAVLYLSGKDKSHVQREEERRRGSSGQALAM